MQDTANPGVLSSTPEDRLAAVGLALPDPISTTHLFSTAIRCGDILYVSGHVPKHEGRFVHQGRLLGKRFPLEEARPIAAQLALSCLATIKSHVAELSKVRQVLKVTGFFVAEEGFTGHSFVLDAASQVLISTFGAAGLHARSAIGVATLPHGAAMELEMVVRLYE